MKVGDMMLYRKPAPWGKKAFFGIVVEYQGKVRAPEGDWALILWGDDTMTWEDADCNLENGTFEVLDGNWRPC